MVSVPEVLLLPVLRRCGEGCEAWWRLILWGSVEAALVLTAIGGISLGLLRLFHLVRVIRSQRDTIAQLNERHLGRIVELFGRATSEMPRRGPLSEQLVAASLLKISGEWQRGSGKQKESVTTERVEEFLDGLKLDDGTGEVRIAVKDSLRYWPEQDAEWPASEAPSWATPPLPADEGYTLIRVTASEEFLPVGTDLYVIGRLTAPGVVEAQVASATTEATTKRALTAEWLSGWILAAVSLLLAVWLIDPVFGSWQRYWMTWSDTPLFLAMIVHTLALFLILAASIVALFVTYGLVRIIGTNVVQP